jgi:hypothetical protein
LCAWLLRKKQDFVVSFGLFGALRAVLQARLGLEAILKFVVLFFYRIRRSAHKLNLRPLQGLTKPLRASKLALASQGFQFGRKTKPKLIH